MVSSAMRPQDGWEQNFRLLFRDQTKLSSVLQGRERTLSWMCLAYCETGVVLR